MCCCPKVGCYCVASLITRVIVKVHVYSDIIDYAVQCVIDVYVDGLMWPGLSRPASTATLHMPVYRSK